MRRRRDQRDTRLGITQPRDVLVDLVARQLAPFPGLGTLRDLDLQHFGVDQILRRDAEAARCHLLDLRHLLDAVGASVYAIPSGPYPYKRVRLPDAEIVTELARRGRVLPPARDNPYLLEEKARP